MKLSWPIVPHARSQAEVIACIQNRCARRRVDRHNCGPISPRCILHARKCLTVGPALRIVSLPSDFGSDVEDNVQYPLYRDDGNAESHYLISEYYYDEDGVALLVGGILYKISRGRLTQDSPIFRDMFSLPVPRDTGEGTLDNPIVLGNTEPVAFEDYLWILHERAPVVEKFMQEEHNCLKLRRLLHILLLTHKYQNTLLHAWAIKHSHRILSSRSVPLFQPFISLVVAAINLMRPGGRTRAAFEIAVRAYLIDGETQVVPPDLLEHVDVSELMSACDAHGLSKLATEARYALLRVHPQRLAESYPRLTKTQLHMLRLGRRALLRRWVRIRDHMLALGQRYNVRFNCLTRDDMLGLDTGLRTRLTAVLPSVEKFCSLPRVAEPDRRIRDVIVRELKTLHDHLELYFTEAAAKG